MPEINDGGPAFPIADPFSVKCPSNEGEALRLRNGLSLRDYFAGKALQGILAGILADGSSLQDDADSNVSALSYKLADAMLRARESSVQDPQGEKS